MPLSNLLKSAAGTCHFCQKKAGILRRIHSQCERTYSTGWNQIVHLAAQAAASRQFNEKALRRSLSTIARRSHGDKNTIARALEEGWRRGVRQAAEDGPETTGSRATWPPTWRRCEKGGSKRRIPPGRNHDAQYRLRPHQPGHAWTRQDRNDRPGRCPAKDERPLLHRGSRSTILSYVTLNFFLLCRSDPDPEPVPLPLPRLSGIPVQRQLLLPVPSIILAGSSLVPDHAAEPLRFDSWGRRIPG